MKVYDHQNEEQESDYSDHLTPGPYTCRASLIIAYLILIGTAIAIIKHMGLFNPN